MGFVKAALLLAVVLSNAMVAPAAEAHGGHVRLGVAIGGPAFWYYPAPYYYYPPPYYSYPPYYYPPVVVAPSSPPVYVERNDVPERPASYWYYCPDTKTYYPYVKECASPWQRVEPRPPS